MAGADSGPCRTAIRNISLSNHRHHRRSTDWRGLAAILHHLDGLRRRSWTSILDCNCKRCASRPKDRTAPLAATVTAIGERFRLPDVLAIGHVTHVPGDDVLREDATANRHHRIGSRILDLENDAFRTIDGVALIIFERIAYFESQNRAFATSRQCCTHINLAFAAA